VGALLPRPDKGGRRRFARLAEQADRDSQRRASPYRQKQGGRQVIDVTWVEILKAIAFTGGLVFALVFCGVSAFLLACRVVDA